MKKAFLIICTSIIVFSLSLCVFANVPPTLGDVDGDSLFTIADVDAICKLCISNSKNEKADMDSSGDITIYDILLFIKKMKSGNKPSFCAVNNTYHDGCVWNYVTLGQYSTINFNAKNHDIGFNIYVPASYSADKEYVLVVFFHGLGGESKPTSSLSGGSLFTNIHYSKYAEDTVYLVPRCPSGMDWPHYRDVRDSVYSLIDYLTKHINIDTDRMYLSGHSYGSIMVSYMIDEHPNTFAAGVMCAGSMKLDGYQNLQALADTPLRMFCGDADNYSFHIRLRALYKELQNLGAKDVEYIEFPGLTHNIFGIVGNYNGLVDWMYSQSLK